MDKLSEMKKRREALSRKSNTHLDNMDQIIDESNRVAQVADNSKVILDELDRNFEKITGLDRVDVTFLFFATALQCARQYFLSNEKFRFDKAADGDKFISKLVPKSYEDILLGPVPYDAFRKNVGYEGLNTGISGANHRYTTLGHDPLLGWIFGTLNILTESLTKNNWALESYRVVNSTKIANPVSIVELFHEGIVCAKMDYKLLAVAVLRQALHLGADAFTKMGLPIPIVNTVSPELSSKLLSEQFRIDLYSVSRSILLASLINSCIAAVHGLFYDVSKYRNRNLYEVKTRKVLSYSNLLATSSNVIYNAVTRDFSKLDIGGMIVTIYRLINDYNFITEVKKEFVFGEFDILIKGE